jgi:hypothetical protein
LKKRLTQPLGVNVSGGGDNVNGGSQGDERSNTFLLAGGKPLSLGFLEWPIPPMAFTVSPNLGLLVFLPLPDSTSR